MRCRSAVTDFPPAADGYPPIRFRNSLISPFDIRKRFDMEQPLNNNHSSLIINSTQAQVPIIICPDCDLVVEDHTIPEGYRLRCPRCLTTLAAPKKNSLIRTAALSLTTLLLFIPAHFNPLLTFDVMGIRQSGSLFDSLVELSHHGAHPVALVALITALILPLCNPALLLTISLLIISERKKHLAIFFLRLHHHLQEWSMTEIFLIAILITIVKMYNSTVIQYDNGLFFYICFTALNIHLALSFDQAYYWRRLTGSQPIFLPDLHGNTSLNAREFNLALCRVCRTSFELNATKPHPEHCPACSAVFHPRTPNSFSRTLALILSAIIFAFPANFLPVMEVRHLGNPELSTIMDGIIYFFKNGSLGIGLIIFIASILVPLFKILGMLIILHAVHYRIETGRRRKTLMLRFIGFIGRWSMLDIFIIALMCSLADFRPLSFFIPQEGTLYFCAVVTLTMMAANSFDSRLLWDPAPHLNGPRHGSTTDI